MKKFLSLLSAFAFVVLLSSFTVDMTSDDCVTEQRVTITNPNEFTVSGTVSSPTYSYEFCISASSSYTYTLSGAYATVCVSDEHSSGDVSVVYSQIEKCGFPSKGRESSSISLICSSSAVVFNGDCKNFSCFSPGF